MSPVMRDALKGAAVGVFLLTAYVVAADYPPQGGGASGDFTAGGDSTFDSLTLDEANADVVLARSAAGTLAVSNGPEADGDGTLVVAEIQNDQGVVMVQGGTNNGNVSLGVNDTNIGAVGNLVAFGAGVGEAWGVLNGSRLRIKSGMEHVWSSSATDPLANAGDTFLSRASAGALRVGATTASADGEVHADNFVAGDDGAVSDPVFRGSDTDTGVYFEGAQISFARNGVRHGYITSDGWNFEQPANVLDDVAIEFGSSADVKAQGELTTLTDGVATTVFSVVTGDGDMAGLVIDYTLQSADGTEYQAESGTVRIAIVDDAGGVVASTPGEVSVQALSSGTLTTAWTVVTTDDQSIEIQLNADTSLTPTTHQIRWKATYSGDVSLTVP